jgi:hypothetical protein
MLLFHHASRMSEDKKILCFSLEEAVLNNDIESVKQLFDQGATWEGIVDTTGRSLLSRAINANCSNKLIDELLSRGIPANGDFETHEMALNSRKIFRTDGVSRYPITLALNCKREDLVVKLCDSIKNNPKYPHHNSEELLLKAFDMNHKALLRHLLIDTQYCATSSALRLAIASERTGLAELLLAVGAIPTDEILDLAFAKENEQLILLILAVGLPQNAENPEINYSYSDFIDKNKRSIHQVKYKFMQALLKLSLVNNPFVNDDLAQRIFSFLPATTTSLKDNVLKCLQLSPELGWGNVFMKVSESNELTTLVDSLRRYIPSLESRHDNTLESSVHEWLNAKKRPRNDEQSSSSRETRQRTSFFPDNNSNNNSSSSSSSSSNSNDFV